MVTISWIVFILLRAIELALFLRAILSWFNLPGHIGYVLERLTEPVIYPMRVLFDKLGINSSLPIDLPYLVTFIVISVLEGAVL